MYEAIILCGGHAWRLKPHTWVPKPLLPIKEEAGPKTLVDLQIQWLKKHGFKNIVLASNQNLKTYFPVAQVIEEKKLGTGGAVKNALDYVESQEVYVMNVDDIVTYDPTTLFEYSRRGAAILLAKPKLGFGMVKTRGNLVVGFQEKPFLDFYVSAGHYVFKRHVIEKYFPDVGDLEKETLPVLAKEKILEGMKLKGDWYTVNTYKDYVTLREKIKSGEIKVFV